jgi:hypothetical protein
MAGIGFGSVFWPFPWAMAMAAAVYTTLFRGLQSTPVKDAVAAAAWSRLWWGMAAAIALLLIWPTIVLDEEIRANFKVPNPTLGQIFRRQERVSVSHDLVWIESLTAAVLLLAWLVAVAARRKRLWALLPVTFALVTATLAMLVSWWAIRLMMVGRIDHPWIGYCLIWTLAFAFASAGVLYRGFRRRNSVALAALDWSPATLASAAAAALVLTGVTLSILDSATTARMAAVASEEYVHLAQMLPPELADSENAAILYEQAGQVLAFAESKEPSKTSEPFVDRFWIDKDQQTSWRQIDPDWLDAHDPRLGLYLKPRAAALDLLHLASRKRGCRFDHDYRRGYSMFVPELQTLNEGCSLLFMDGLFAAGAEDWGRAEADLAAILRLPRHMNDPLAITFLNAASVEGRAAALMEKLLAVGSNRKGVLDSADLKELLGDPADDSHFVRQMRRAYRGEEALGAAQFPALTVYYVLDRIQPKDSLSLEARLGFGAPWMLQTFVYRLYFLADDLASYRNRMEHLQRLLAMPYWKAADAIKAGSRVQLGEELSPWDPEPVGLIASVALPRNMELQFRIATQADAVHRLMRLAYGVTRYRSKFGKDPGQLDDLVPEFMGHVPLDPFDGKPLRMKKADKGLILYSVGVNLVDDGGVDGKEGQGDITFRVP